jgi:hypothetical protein
MTRARDTADTQDNLGGAVPPFAAGKNKIINGDLDVWQRGTTFTNPASGAFTADRWRSSFETAAPTSYEITRQTFTPGNEPVSGYNSQYFLRGVLTTVGTCTKIRIQQRIENVGTFANMTITVSFYAKSDSNRTQTVGVEQLFGSGGSSAVLLTEQTINTTTAWQRFSLQFAVPGISGKTIGTGSSTQITINQNLTNGNTLDIWGVQAEAGSTASPFQTATGTVQGELAACQRYYYRTTPGAIYTTFSSGWSSSTTAFLTVTPLPVVMRIAPTALEQTGTAANYGVFHGATGTTCSAVPAFYHATTSTVLSTFTVASGLTTGQAGVGRTDNSTAGYLGWSAEL